MEDKKPSIVVKNISKKFSIGFKRNDSFLAKILCFSFGDEIKKELWALKNVSFDVNAGENLGIIGRNGSGKSTLLRVIAGVFPANEGEVETNGKLIYLTGFGQGLKPKLTMRENIYLIGSIMGLSQKDIKKRFNEIIEFSGLKNFLDVKVYKFSSGMIARLNFSIGIHCLKHSNPDILLFDEVFHSGGDIYFKKKIIEKMEEFLKGGTTVILVSHDLETIKKYCDKVLWLERGEVIKYGEPNEIVEAYEISV
ncbi:MAG: ABC transporter ATP-binding protein [Nanoarchaeota archaeon]|nr:ABC transporter ATP-binding protein [Nanoarchaeota archaeon]